MSPTRVPGRKEPRETPAPDVVSSPPVAAGNNEYIAFVWQQLNAMQATLGKLQQAIEHQTADIEKLDTKADETKEKIHSINVKLAVSAAIVTVAFAVTAFVAKEVWDVVKPTIVQRLTAEPAANQAAQPQRATGAAAPAASRP